MRFGGVWVCLYLKHTAVTSQTGQDIHFRTSPEPLIYLRAVWCSILNAPHLYLFIKGSFYKVIDRTGQGF